MFSVVAEKEGLRPVSRTQMMIRSARARREHSQAASPSRPMEIFHTINVMLSLWRGVGVGKSVFSVVWVHWEFSLFSGVLQNLQFSRFHDCCSGTGCKLVIGWWEKHIIYSLFCIFIIIIISIIISVLLKCLYLNWQVFPFVRFSSPSLLRKGASGCLVRSCQLLG